MAIKDETDFYNVSYKRANYFHYRTWVYARYISSLIAICGLKKGASVLDVGCGQGFFSHLFAKQGMKVYGIDLSETGLRAAETLYGGLGISFEVADVQTVNFQQQFDCVFVRSCSLYNTGGFRLQRQATDGLLRHLKDSGTMIFAYNSNFSSKERPKWRHHSLTDAQEHFGSYPNTEVFFVNRITGCLFGRLSFHRLATRLSILLSRALGVGGDLVCLVRKQAGVISDD